MRLNILLIAIFFLLILATSIEASKLTISPARIYLKPGMKTVVAEVKNESEKSVKIQIDSTSWSQENTGKDIYQPTEDLIVYPPLLEVGSGESRSVRIAFVGKPKKDQESHYRIFFQEIPEKIKQKDALNINLRFGVPVFIPPEKKST